MQNQSHFTGLEFALEMRDKVKISPMEKQLILQCKNVYFIFKSRTMIIEIPKFHNHLLKFKDSFLENVKKFLNCADLNLIVYELD